MSPVFDSQGKAHVCQLATDTKPESCKCIGHSQNCIFEIRHEPHIDLSFCVEIWNMIINTNYKIQNA